MERHPRNHAHSTIACARPTLRSPSMPRVSQIPNSNLQRTRNQLTSSCTRIHRYSRLLPSPLHNKYFALHIRRTLSPSSQLLPVSTDRCTDSLLLYTTRVASQELIVSVCKSSGSNADRQASKLSLKHAVNVERRSFVPLPHTTTSPRILLPNAYYPTL
ncbi:hypothetical protein BDY19DRAFT_217009 [Irpex rosettiformis]|uniref:Uncharacterized protein n=1 Tax=Irpex rosettiformis TaxID=378272 RepID=A0ACB8U0R4_9APHY|nr:hypothetical protein BDY19DRAFT_217009 [Irpex rosettiformis]